MAKLYLEFERTRLKEFPLTTAIVTIGRLPDNQIQVDNPAVSGHHAKVFWEIGHFVIEDNNSLNGTFINDQRITRQVLNDGDNIVIGKHTLTFKDEGQEYLVPSSTVAVTPPLPTMEDTMVLDTKKGRDMMAHAAAKARPAAGAEAASAAATPALDLPPPVKVHRHLGGLLSVISGKTDQSEYALISKLSVIGKSDMASVKLKGCFAPKVDAEIIHRDNKYFIAASGNNQKVKVNGALIAGQKKLNEGDMIEVANVKMTFSYSD